MRHTIDGGNIHQSGSFLGIALFWGGLGVLVIGILWRVLSAMFPLEAGSNVFIAVMGELFLFSLVPVAVGLHILVTAMSGSHRESNCTGSEDNVRNRKPS